MKEASIMTQDTQKRLSKQLYRLKIFLDFLKIAFRI
jgi:hypothetical protein